MKLLYMILLAAAMTVLPSIASAQESDSLAFINSLDSKKAATFSDAVIFMAYIVNGHTLGFKADLASLKAKGIVTNVYDAKDPLKRGNLAKMIAIKLKLKESLLFNITGSERYAFRACSAAGIMPARRSEYDTLSGTELIEIMSRLP